VRNRPYCINLTGPYKKWIAILEASTFSIGRTCCRNIEK
jgi:hypothetical protein